MPEKFAKTLLSGEPGDTRGAAAFLCFILTTRSYCHANQEMRIFSYFSLQIVARASNRNNGMSIEQLFTQLFLFAFILYCSSHYTRIHNVFVCMKIECIDRDFENSEWNANIKCVSGGDDANAKFECYNIDQSKVNTKLFFEYVVNTIIFTIRLCSQPQNTSFHHTNSRNTQVYRINCIFSFRTLSTNRDGPHVENRKSIIHLPFAQYRNISYICRRKWTIKAADLKIDVEMPNTQQGSKREKRAKGPI